MGRRGERLHPFDRHELVTREALLCQKFLKTADRPRQNAAVTIERAREAVANASRIVAFYSGRILADGTPAAVLADDEVKRYVTGTAT